MGPNELLVLLLSLTGFGVEPNPQAPPAAEVLRYAPDGADYMLYLDAQAVVPNNYKVLLALRDLPAVKADHELKAAVDMVVNEVETARGAAKGMLGIDPVQDVKSVAGWIQLADAGEPAFVVVVRGNFPKDLLDKIAAATGATPQTIEGRTILSSPDGQAAIAMGADGALIAGSPDLVKPRVRPTWSPVRGRPGSLLAETAPLLEGKPFFVVASSPSPTTVRAVQRELGSKEDAALGVDLLTGHAFAAIALAHNGVTWTVTARDDRGYQRAVMASEGALELMRAAHLATRGFAHVVFAALPSYAKVPEVAALLAHRDDLLELLMTTTGDGTFRADVKKVPGKRTVSVHAFGKELSEVLPAVGVLPAAGALFFLTARKKEAAVAAPAIAAPPPARTPGKPLPPLTPTVPPAHR